MMNDYSNLVLTYGLTREENGLLMKHTEFQFEDVSEHFTDLLAFNSVAMIMNPDKLSQNELEQLFEVYTHGHAPLFIFTSPAIKTVIPSIIAYKVCDVFERAEIMRLLHRAKNS